MRIYAYILRCDDAEETIIGNHKLNLQKEVAKALKAMSNEEVVSPVEDWFMVIVGNVCKNTGFSMLDSLDGDYYVEDDYFDEVQKREQFSQE